MDKTQLTISQTAEILGVSIDTLRRWDKDGVLVAQRNKKNNYRYYQESDVENYLINNPKKLFHLAKNWAFSQKQVTIPSIYFCADRSIFKARLPRLESDLSKISGLKNIFPLISAAAGEIGNNSFDHNLGNWPDVMGIFFGYNLKHKEIVLADRGQGILKTLKKVRPELIDDRQALKIAFTEIISGRAPESRGNGLKFVREIMSSNPISLLFQSGDAVLQISKDDPELKIKESKNYLQGCLALIKF